MADYGMRDFNKNKEQNKIELSHKIRTQASNVTGFLELLKASNLNDEQTEYVTKLQTYLFKLFKTIKENTDIPGIEYNEYENTKVSFGMINEINNTINTLKSLSQKNNVEIFLDLNPNLPNLLIGERFIPKILLTDILTNIINKSDDCIVKLDVFKYREGKSKFEIMFNIQTDSMDIDKNSLNQILKREYKNFNLYTNTLFYQPFDFKNNLALQSEATPITLLENGYYDISFSYIFDKVSANKTAANNFTGMKVLSVDDDPVNQKVMAKLMMRFNINCDIEINGQTAIDAYKNNMYDLIFMDCQMPVLDGYEATKKIREIEKNTGRHTPIVAITACAMKGDKEKCIESGMDDYLTKPVNVKHIEGVLVKYSAQKRTHST